MRYHFDTDDESAAVAALLLYATWRSRDTARFKITPDVWDQVTRFVKASAKRARSIPEFLDSLMPRLCAGSLKPRWLAVGYRGLTAFDNHGVTEYIQLAEQREFLTGILERSDHRQVLDRLFRETAWVVLLVRDRLEREKALESKLPIDALEESL